MNRGRSITGIGVVVAALLFLAGAGPIAWAAQPGPEDADEWKDDTPQQVSILTPDSYLPINHEQALLAAAGDWDCYRVGETWYSYSDDVTSGETETDWHIVWMLAGGSDGEIVDPYGVGGQYLAPDYESGEDMREIVIMAACEDYNRGDDTFGWNDTNAGTAELLLKVWQVRMEVDQDGSVHDYYDGPSMPDKYGAGDLGWVEFDDPEDCEHYGANTQIRGTIPEEAGETEGYQWMQQKRGTSRVWKSGASDWTYLQNLPTWVMDGDPADYDYIDPDSKSPNGTGTPRWLIFFRDCPGQEAGPNNDRGIGPPSNYIILERDMHYRTWVNLDGVTGKRVSNYAEWRLKFQTIEDNGKWKVNGAHIPAQ